MSESYSSIIEGLEELLSEIETLRGDEIRSYLAEIWFDVRRIMNTKYRQKGSQETKELTVKEYIKDRPYKILDLANRSYISWIDRQPNNFEYADLIRSFKEELISVLKPHKSQILKEAVLNIFFRLTNYNNGAMVPLQDLLDIYAATMLFPPSKLPRESSPSPGTLDFNFVYSAHALRRGKLAIEGMLFTLKCMNVKFPAPYYPGLGVLERTDELYKTILQLEEAFQQPKTKKSS
ncbi:hypothetical protein ES705_33295 [subsurface metagenome]